MENNYDHLKLNQTSLINLAGSLTCYLAFFLTTGLSTAARDTIVNFAKFISKGVIASSAVSSLIIGGGIFVLQFLVSGILA